MDATTARLSRLDKVKYCFRRFGFRVVFWIVLVLVGCFVFGIIVLVFGRCFVFWCFGRFRRVEKWW